MNDYLFYYFESLLVSKTVDGVGLPLAIIEEVSREWEASLRFDLGHGLAIYLRFIYVVIRITLLDLFIRIVVHLFCVCTFILSFDLGIFLVQENDFLHRLTLRLILRIFLCYVDLNIPVNHDSIVTRELLGLFSLSVDRRHICMFIQHYLSSMLIKGPIRISSHCLCFLRHLRVRLLLVT